MGAARQGTRVRGENAMTSVCAGFSKNAMMQAPEREGEGEGKRKKKKRVLGISLRRSLGGRRENVARAPRSKGENPAKRGPARRESRKKNSETACADASILQVRCTHWSKASGSATLPHQRFSAQLSVLFKPREATQSRNVSMCQFTCPWGLALSNYAVHFLSSLGLVVVVCRYTPSTNEAKIPYLGRTNARSAPCHRHLPFVHFERTPVRQCSMRKLGE